MSPTDVLCLLLASTLGLVVTVQALCLPPIAEPNTVLSDADNLKPEFPNGATATFACVPGYVHQGGSRTVTCIDGTWTPLTLQCARRNCGSPGEIPNGSFNITGTLFGDMIVATCDVGYLMIGLDRRTCMANGWSGRNPVCEAVRCIVLPAVAHASASPIKDVYTYRDVVSYTCNEDYTLKGSSSLSCSPDGTFQPAPPECIRVVCPSPDVPNGYWDTGARPPYGYMDFVTYKCNPGFTPQGASSSSCSIDSIWTPDLLRCVREPVPVTPTDPAPPTTTTTTNTATTTTPPIPTNTATTTTPPIPTTRVSGPGPVEPTKPAPHNIGVTVGITLGVVVAFAGAILVALMVKKKRGQSGYSGKVATKDEDREL